MGKTKGLPRQISFQRFSAGVLTVGILSLSQPVFAQATPLPLPPENTPTNAPANNMTGPASLPSSSSSTLQVGAGTQKVPAGTFMTIAFNTGMDSRMTTMGEPFNAFITEDFTVRGDNGGSRVVLPVGTIVRGRVNEVKRPSLFSRGGAIYLAFDHVVLPSGELLPLTLNLSTENTIVNKAGALYMDPGIGAKVEKGFEEGKHAFSTITDSGYQAGKNIAGGFGSILTVPAAVIGGALAGTAVTTGKAAVAVVGRGETALIKPGDTVTIDFGGSFNLPSE